MPQQTQRHNPALGAELQPANVAPLPSASIAEADAPRAASSIGLRSDPINEPRSWTSAELKEKFGRAYGDNSFCAALTKEKYSEAQLDLLARNIRPFFELDYSLHPPGIPSWFGLAIVKRNELASAFIANPREVSGALRRLMRELKEPSDIFAPVGLQPLADVLSGAEFGGNERAVINSFVKNPGEFVERFLRIANSGVRTDLLVRLLRNEDCLDRFEKTPESLSADIKSLSEKGNFAPALRGETASAFAKKPEEVIAAAKTLAAAFGKDIGTVVYLLAYDPQLSKEFFRDPRGTAEKIGAFGSAGLASPSDALAATVLGPRGLTYSDGLIADLRAMEGLGPRKLGECYFLANDPRIVAAFRQSPERVREALAEVEKLGSVGELAAGLSSISLGAYAGLTLEYAQGLLSKAEFHRRLEVNIAAEQPRAIERGRILDDLHDRPAERQKYLDSLSTAQVLGLACSEPSLFYTSTNNMILDRIQKDFKGRDITKVLDSYGLLNSKEARNLVFRALTYARLEGRPNSIFKSAEMQVLAETLTSPITKGEADLGYYYLLDNGLKSFGVGELRVSLGQIVKDRLRDGSPEGADRGALTFLDIRLNGDAPYQGTITAEELSMVNGAAAHAKFDRRTYLRDGKLDVIQIFAREDTEKDHFPLTLSTLRHSGFRVLSQDVNRVELERADARVSLFIGSPDENQDFLKRYQQEHKNFILCFRGHSFSLEDNIPPESFGDSERSILFIPGSCGSSGAVPEYLTTNLKTDLQFISNSSTGRGQVTNAILDGLLAARRPESFQSIMLSKSRQIEAAGGSIETLDTWTEGMSLVTFAMLPRWGGLKP